MVVARLVPCSASARSQCKQDHSISRSHSLAHLVCEGAAGLNGGAKRSTMKLEGGRCQDRGEQ
jgi:hypothetical protein